MNGAIYTLCEEVAESIKKYDASRDHTRHEPGADCIRCKIAETLPHYVGDRRGPTGTKKSTVKRATDRLIKHCRENEAIVMSARRIIAKVDAAMQELEADQFVRALKLYHQRGEFDGTEFSAASCLGRAEFEVSENEVKVTLRIWCALEALREGLAYAAGDEP